MLQTIWSDIRYAARGLRQSPGFAATAVLTVAAGIAGPSLIFSLANWTLLRPVGGVVEPHRVGAVATATFRETSYSPNRVEYADYFDLRRALTTLDLAGHQGTSVVVTTADRPARTIGAEFVTASYLRVLGVPMSLGRHFTDEEDVPGAAVANAIISDRLWNDLFALDPGVLERTVRINGRSFAIIGVTSDGFAGTRRIPPQPPDIWLPGAAYYLANPAPARPGAPAAPGYYSFIGRLQPGVTWEQAGSELQGVAGWLLARDATRYENFKSASARIDGPIGHDPFFRSATVTFLSLMLAGTAILLLIACSNVSTMLLARNGARTGEIAVRRALGGSVADLVRSRIVEGTLMWLCGAALALGLVYAVTQLVDGYTLLGERFTGGEVPVDWRIVAFTGLVALAAGVVSSLVPALAAARTNPAVALKAGAPTLSTRNGLATAFIGIQLAASLALVVGALLLTTSVRRLAAVDLGFDHDRTYFVRLNLRAGGYVGERGSEYVRRFVERVSTAPGVSHVAGAAQVPIVNSNTSTLLKPSRDPLGKLAVQEVNVLSPDYFDALRIPVVKGRPFDERDFDGAGRDRVIISERLARELFGDAEPIGQMVEYRTLNRRDRPGEVIGVAADIQVTSIEGVPELAVYQIGDGLSLNTAVVVRMATDADPTAILRAAGMAIDANVPIERVEPITTLIEARRRERRVLATLMTVVAGIAILLTGVGLAAIVSSGIASRVREFGIRIALGATPRRVGRHAFQRTALVTVVGLIAGSGAAAGLARFLRSHLFGVGPFDPVVWTLAVTGLVLIAVAASWIPVRRAIRLDVARTLRV